jgi:hypothetical protein
LKGSISVGTLIISSAKEIVTVSTFFIFLVAYFVRIFTIPGADPAHKQAEIPASFASQSLLLEIFIHS